MLVLYFSFYHFYDFLTAFAKDFMKKQPVFIMNIKSSDKFLVSHINLRSRNLSQWNDSPLKFCEICMETHILLQFLQSLNNLRLRCYRNAIFQVKSTCHMKNQVSKTFG